MQKTIKYMDEELIISIDNYVTAPLVMAIRLNTTDNRPFCTASVNLGNTQTERPDSFVQPGCTYIDTNNVPNIDKIFINLGLAIPYVCFGEPQIGYSGFCEYPLLQFDMEKLKEYDEEGIKKYQKTYFKELPKAQERMFNQIFR